MDTPITLSVEISEDLYDYLRLFLDQYPHWDFDQVFQVALLHFLKQAPVNK
jgi:hypothetical protein